MSMVTTGLDGVTRLWRWKDKKRSKVSSYHLAARKLIVSIWSCDRVLEEVFLPLGRGFPKAYADFFLPARRLIVEVQGEQHYAPTAFFHRTPGSLMGSLRRDDYKRRWCETNNLRFVELPFDEDPETRWRARLLPPVAACPEENEE